MNAHTASIGLGSKALNEVAAVIGDEAALALALEFRGVGFYVSRDCKREPRIAKAIGAELAERFCNAFHGLPMTLPTGEAERRAVVHLATTRPDLTNRQIAETLHIKERQVYRLLKKGESAPRVRAKPRDARQIDMFGS